MWENTLWFIILNYNNYIDTLACLNSVHANNDDRYMVVVVDNHSDDYSGHMLEEKFPNDIFLHLDVNGGYAAGNNAGINYAFTRGAEYICVLNNDVVIPKDFVGKTLDCLDMNPSCGIVAPIICEYRNPDIVQSAGATMNLLKGNGRFLHQGERVDSVNLLGDNPDYLGGACFIARKKVFDRIGMLPEFYFLFYEETDWFFLAREKEIKFSCNKNLRVYHKGSASIEKIHGLSCYYLTRNQVVFERRKASAKQFLFFVLYSTCRWVYHLVKDQKRVFPLKAFCDGLFLNLPQKE